MRHVDPGRFPNIVAALREAGLDPERELIPVAPASHYVMGGIATDLDGRADGVPGLYAVGECACTGLHGANRLASNSLSECFVFGRRAALSGLQEPPVRGAEPEMPAEPVAPAPTRETREAMWRHAGLERDARGPRSAAVRSAPPRPSGRRERALAAREPRRPHPLRPPGDRSGTGSAAHDRRPRRRPSVHDRLGLTRRSSERSRSP